MLIAARWPQKFLLKQNGTQQRPDDRLTKHASGEDWTLPQRGVSTLPWPPCQHIYKEQPTDPVSAVSLRRLA